MKKEFAFAEDYKPLIPNGMYEAQCIAHNSGFHIGKTRKTFLHFKILDPIEHIGKKIFMVFNMPYDKEIKMGSKYYKTWCFVNNWQKPSKNSKMSPRLFKNKIYKITTRTVKPKHNGKEMPNNFWYSVIDEIVQVLAG
jgi:hypothetical protein